MRIRIATGILAMVMLMTLTGCGNTGGAKNPEDGKGNSSPSVQLHVTTTYAGEDTNAENYKTAVQEWEKKTGNTVEDSSASSDETFKTRILMDFETGSEPDVLFFFSGVDAAPFVKHGKVVSIDEIREEYPEYATNMKEEMLAASPVDDKKYAVPVNGYWEGLFVNKEVLANAGVKIPTADTTWEEFLDICERIKEAGYIPIAASLQDIPHYWFEFAIYNHQDVETHNTLPAEVSDAYGQAWVEGLTDIKEMYEKGYFPINTLLATDGETSRLFTADKAAFLLDGSWKTGAIEEAVDDIENYTVTYVPGMGKRKSTDIIGGLSMGYYITRKCWENPEKRAAAVDFVTYMTSDEKVSLFAGTSANALNNGTRLEESTLTALDRAGVEYCAGATGLSLAVQDSLSEASRAPVFSGMADIVTGNKTIEEVVEEVIQLNEE